MGLREINVDLTKEHVALWNETKKFVTEVWRPAAIHLDSLADPNDVIAKDSVLWEVLRKSFALGYHTLNFPKEFGGEEIDAVGGALVAELMGWAAPDLAVSFGCCPIPFQWAMLYPEPEMQDLVRKFIADKEANMTGCWAITEPDHGSDWILFEGEDAENPNCSPSLRAVKDGDSYILNGQKSSWVSNGTFAKYAALFLGIDPCCGMASGGIAVVPLDLPGITRGKPLNKLGQRALNQGEIFFDNVRIPKSMMVASDPVNYKNMANLQLTGANGGMGLCFAGTALAAFEEALEYAQTRVQGGRPIIHHKNIKLALFDMFISVEAARSLARRVAVYNMNRVRQMQTPAVHYAMAAKIMSTETAFRVASQAVQIFGGYGLSKEFHIEKIFRDARASMIEDGTNEVLAISGTDKIAAGKNRWMVNAASVGQTAASGAAGASGLSWDEVEPIFRPKGVIMGSMTADPEKCTHCGLCLQNCPFRAWELDENEVPRMKEKHECFSCFNCMVVCPADAISIQETYKVTQGFFVTDPLPLAVKMPLEPKNAENKKDEWNLIEKTILERRSVRNFKTDPVPEPIIKRVLEAGRFAPSGGNCQPWKFIVVTDKALINEMNDAIFGILSMMDSMYKNDTMVQTLIPVYAADPRPGTFDPRVITGGVGSIAARNAPVFLDAPVVILVACDDRAIGGPQIQAGICGQNMNLAAKSLGLGCCWVGFSQVIEMAPAVKEKLGLADPWKINTALVLGYPKFKQEGMVPREFRPVRWFRDGAKGPVEES